MRRILPILLLLLLLAGCSGMFPSDYIDVAEHVAPFAYKETTAAPTEPPPETEAPLPTASIDSDIRKAIQNMVLNGQEEGQILAVNYEGDLEADMKNMLYAMREDSPKYVYAIHPDSFNSSLHRTAEGVVITVRMKLRLTGQEVQAIQTRLFPQEVMPKIYDALNQHLSFYTVQASGYSDTDFASVLDQYILHHPDKVAEAPGISVAVYPPDRGNLRVLEFHFDYNNTQDSLRAHQDETANVLRTALRQLSAARSAQQAVNTLYKHLVPAIGYEDLPETTVYSLVVEKKGGSSRIMASVVEYLCREAGWSCEIVIGEREGERWYWNRLESEGQWLYFDLHTAGLTREAPLLQTAAEMTEYQWDPELYPELEPPEPPTEPTEPSGHAEDPTEPSAPTGPTESGEAPTAPTEPTAEQTETSEPEPSETAETGPAETAPETTRAE